MVVGGKGAEEVEKEEEKEGPTEGNGKRNRISSPTCSLSS